MLGFLLRRKPKVRRSSQWPVLRARWLKDNPFCAACRGTKTLEVHHKKPVHLYPALELDLTNLITLCEANRDCHLDIGHLGNWKLENSSVIDMSSAYMRALRTATTPKGGT